jgi:FkbM family methyltransferase
MMHNIVRFLKRLFYGKGGEPYNYYGNIARFRVGTRPFKLKYVDSKDWDVRNDVLQLQYLKQHFSDNGVLWDIGACNGEYGILASTLLKDKKGKIFCFEPDNSAMESLKDNLRLNGLSDCVGVFPLAVSDTKGQLEFLDFKGNANSRLILDGKSEGNKVIVNATTLEDLVAELPLPSLVKIDVEGAELRVLTVAKTLLERKDTVFLVELHPWAYPQYKADFDALLELLASVGRKVKILDDQKTMADMPAYGSIVF